jgi:hypothetical protein
VKPNRGGLDGDGSLASLPPMRYNEAVALESTPLTKTCTRCRRLKLLAFFIKCKAAERGISVMPLSSCYLHRAKRKGLILGYGATNPHQIRQAIRALKTIIET